MMMPPKSVKKNFVSLNKTVKSSHNKTMTFNYSPKLKPTVSKLNFINNEISELSSLPAWESSFGFKKTMKLSDMKLTSSIASREQIQNEHKVSDDIIYINEND